MKIINATKDFETFLAVDKPQTEIVDIIDITESDNDVEQLEKSKSKVNDLEKDESTPVQLQEESDDDVDEELRPYTKEVLLPESNLEEPLTQELSEMSMMEGKTITKSLKELTTGMTPRIDEQNSWRIVLEFIRKEQPIPFFGDNFKVFRKALVSTVQYGLCPLSEVFDNAREMIRAEKERLGKESPPKIEFPVNPTPKMGKCSEAMVKKYSVDKKSKDELCSCCYKEHPKKRCGTIEKVEKVKSVEPKKEVEESEMITIMALHDDVKVNKSWSRGFGGDQVPTYPNKKRPEGPLLKRNKEGSFRNKYLVSEVDVMYMIKALVPFEQVITLPAIKGENMGNVRKALTVLFDTRDTEKIPNRADVIIIAGSFHTLRHEDLVSLTGTVMYSTGQATVLLIMTDQARDIGKANSYKAREKVAIAMASKLNQRTEKYKYQESFPGKRIYVFQGGYKNLGTKLLGIAEGTHVHAQGPQVTQARMVFEDYLGVNTVSAIFSTTYKELDAAYYEVVVPGIKFDEQSHFRKRKWQWDQSQLLQENKLLRWNDEDFGKARAEARRIKDFDEKIKDSKQKGEKKKKSIFNRLGAPENRKKEVTKR